VVVFNETFTGSEYKPSTDLCRLGSLHLGGRSVFCASIGAGGNVVGVCLTGVGTDGFGSWWTGGEFDLDERVEGCGIGLIRGNLGWISSS
jgi:hypothetical protein